MTKDFVQKLEDKISLLLMELKTLRTDINLLKHENSSLKAEKAHSISQMQKLILSVNTIVQPVAFNEQAIIKEGNDY